MSRILKNNSLLTTFIATARKSKHTRNAKAQRFNRPLSGFGALTFFILSFIDDLVQLPITQPPLNNLSEFPLSSVSLFYAAVFLSQSDSLLCFYLLLSLRPFSSSLSSEVGENLCVSHAAYESSRLIAKRSNPL